MDFDELSNRAIGCAIEAHREIGPGLLESAYEQCLSPLRALRVLRGEMSPLHNSAPLRES